MKSNIIKYTYGEQVIEFDMSGHDVMVNATEMSKPFGKLVADFWRLDQTKAFVQECLNYGKSHNSENEKTDNSPFLGIRSQDDLYVSRQRSGTWMHRILALKFAAWLNPRFELWVYLTIDQILQGQQPVHRSVIEERKEVMNRKNEAIEEAKRTEAELLESDVYKRWQASQGVIKTADNDLKRLAKQAVGQLDLFINRSEDE